MMKVEDLVFYTFVRCIARARGKPVMSIIGMPSLTLM